MADTESQPVGRPSGYTDELAATICGRLAEGESLRSICATEGMPASSTVFLWLAKHPVFSEQYVRAREAQADAIFDEMLDIADDGRNDYVDQTRSDGSVDQVFDAEHVQRSKLRVDTRKWMASKLAPKKYGEKLDLTHGNPDGTALAPPILNVTFVKPDGSST